MKLARPIIASLMVLGLSNASLAGDLQDSITRAARQQASSPSPRAMDKGYLYPGAAMFVAGMSMALYGFLHTNGGEFVSGEVSKESNTGLGAAGLAVAGAGGALLYIGSQRARHAPSITVTPDRLTISKRLTW